MPQSTRFSVAVHVLALLAIKKGECVSSDCIAKSVATNPVVVRRMLSLLQQAGFVKSRAGINGGARLEMDAKAITLLDVYHAVEEQSVFRTHEPHPQCEVAFSVKKDVEELLNHAEQVMEKELSKTTLADIARRAKGAG